MGDDVVLDVEKMMVEETASAAADAAIVAPEQIDQALDSAAAVTGDLLAEAPSIIENPIVSFLCDLLGKIPCETMDYEFMRMALLGLLIIAPMAAVCGTQVVNFNMSFFSDAIGHSAFAGVATGLVLAISPEYTMPALALCVGLGIMAIKHRSGLSSDTVIGVMFSAVVAGGLAIVSRYPNAVSDAQMFLYGDILTISERDILLMMGLAVVFTLFQIFSFNKLICIELNPQLAKAHRIKVGVYQYFFAALLSLVVIFSVKAVGVLLVTAMLITPAAAARNLASSYGKMLWISVVIGIFSAITGLFLSAQDWMQTSTGATIVLCSCLIFAISLIFRKKKRA